MSELPAVYSRVQPKDFASTAEINNALLDMVRAKIEEGKVDSLVVFMVAKDDADPNGYAYCGSRFIVRPWHMAAMADLFADMMTSLSNQYGGLTAEDVREVNRRKGN